MTLVQQKWERFKYMLYGQRLRLRHWWYRLWHCDNWYRIIDKSVSKFGTKYQGSWIEGEFTFVGVAHMEDDYYYIMYGKDTGKCEFLSCVGSIECFGFEEIQDESQ